MDANVFGQRRHVREDILLALADSAPTAELPPVDVNTQAPPHQQLSEGLTEEQWHSVAPLFPESHKQQETGRPKMYGLRNMFEAVVWMLRHDSKLRSLPKGFPPWGTLHYQISKWVHAGTLQTVLNVLGDQELIAEARKRIKTYDKFSTVQHGEHTKVFRRHKAHF